MGSRFDSEEIKFRNELRKIEREGQRLERKRFLKEKKNSYKIPKKKPSMSKLVVWAMVLIVFEIIIWAEYEMHRLDDLSQIYALIGVVTALAPVLWRYFAKSEAENTKGGIVYDSLMNEPEPPANDPDDESVG